MSRIQPLITIRNVSRSSRPGLISKIRRFFIRRDNRIAPEPEPKPEIIPIRDPSEFKVERQTKITELSKNIQQLLLTERILTRELDANPPFNEKISIKTDLKIVKNKIDKLDKKLRKIRTSRKLSEKELDIIIKRKRKDRRILTGEEKLVDEEREFEAKDFRFI
jgi:hypothetical protein